MQAIEGHDAAGGAHGEVGSIVDEPADLDQVVEDGGVDGSRARGVVVDVDKGLQYLMGKLQPWSVEGGYVAPVSAADLISNWTRRIGFPRSNGLGARILDSVPPQHDRDSAKPLRQSMERDEGNLR